MYSCIKCCKLNLELMLIMSISICSSSAELGNEHCIYYIYFFIHFSKNIGNKLFDIIWEIKCPLLNRLKFKSILNSWLLSPKCRQRERTSQKDVFGCLTTAH